jgi:hypothetical protein
VIRRFAAWFEQATYVQVILAGVIAGCAAGALAAIVHHLAG